MSVGEVATHHRVLLVGPWRSDTVAGCCAATPQALGYGPAENRPSASHQDHTDVGVVLRAIRASATPGVDVQLVDPRNTMFLLGAVSRDAWRCRHGIRALMTAVRATTPWTLIADGRIVSRRRPLTPDQAVALLPVELTGHSAASLGSPTSSAR